MCAQVRNPRDVIYDTSPLEDAPLGLPPDETAIGLQQDVVKELVNKIAWTLGSVYRKPYSSMRTPARAYAWRIVKQVIRSHGYPEKIAKE